MHEDILFLAEFELVVYRPRGLLDPSQVRSAQDRIMDLGEPAWRADKFNDLSEVEEFRLDHDSLEALAARPREHRESYGAIRSALFSPSELGYGLARLFGSLASQSWLRVRAFRDLGDVSRWLGRPPEALSPPSPRHP